MRKIVFSWLGRVLKVLLCVPILLQALVLLPTPVRGDNEVREIRTVEDLLAVSEDLGGTYRLEADLNMAGVAFSPIGNEKTGVFTGSFDGNGHTISNLDVYLPDNKYVGLFGCLDGATVKNLRLTNVRASGYRYVGGIAGCALGECSIENCQVSGSVEAVYAIIDVNVGGIVGYFEAGTVSGCENAASVYGHYQTTGTKIAAGGIVGKNNAGELQNCDNGGDVTAKSELPNNSSYGYAYAYAGGIIGLNEQGAVSSCNNCGEINSSAYGYSDYSYNGGILGKTEKCIVQNCANYGSIGKSADYGGGIVGYGERVLVRSCFNAGEICSSYCGGAAGFISKGNVSESINNGYIHGSSYIGGIAGYASSSDITRCVNCGPINGGVVVGGILGIGGSTVSICENNGPVITSAFHDYYLGDTSAGGIVSRPSECEIVNCINRGFISATTLSMNSQTGQISIRSSVACGIARNTANIVINTLNSGSVNATSTSGVPVGAFSSFYLDQTVAPDGVFSRGMNELQDITTYEEFDFENVWFIQPGRNSGLPQLRNLPEHLVLNECVLILTPGDRRSLVAYWQDEPTDVTWSSDDQAVASVLANGTVVAAGPGDCMISARDNEGNRTNCMVHVYTPADQLRLNESDLTLAVGSTKDLRCTLTPSDCNEVLGWTSSAPEVASVDRTGKVTALRAGSAVITAETVASGMTVICAVTVTNAVASITITSNPGTVNVGETKNIGYQVSPEIYSGSLHWSSSDESVAIVDENGAVTGVSNGTAVITVTADSGVAKEMTITVKTPANGITLNKGSITLEIGLKEQLTAALSPESSTDSISWSSNNSNVASVDASGMVTAKKAGTAVISATASSGAKAYCSVTVTAASVPVSQIGLDQQLMVLVQGESGQLTATIQPANASDIKLTWTSSNEQVATVTDWGTVTAVGEGRCMIQVTAESGVTQECDVRVVSAAGASVTLCASPAMPGEALEVKAVITKNPGISAYRFTVQYNTSLLEAVAVTPNANLGGSFETNLGESTSAPLTVLWYHTDDVTQDGELFTLTFRVVDSVSLGTIANVSLSYTPMDICNAAGINQALYVGDTDIRIDEPLPGDVVEDGDVNVLDINLLARYVTALEQFTSRQQLASDVNDDDDTDILDVVLLARWLVHMDGVVLRSAPVQENTPQVTIDEVSGEAGTVLEVPVRIQGNPGITGYRFELNYEPNDLEILALIPNEDYAPENFRSNLGLQANNLLTVTWYDTQARTEDGILFTVRLQRKPGASNCSVLEIIDRGNNLCDGYVHRLQAAYISGKIKAPIISQIRSVSIHGDPEAAEIPAEDFTLDIAFDLPEWNTTAVRILVACYREDGCMLFVSEATITNRSDGGCAAQSEISYPSGIGRICVYMIDSESWMPLSPVYVFGESID